MAQLTIELPDELVADLRVEAERTHTTAEALLARHVAANPPQPVFVPPPGYYASLWGAAAGGRGRTDRQRRWTGTSESCATSGMTVSLRGRRPYLDASVAIYAMEKLHEFPNLQAGFLDLLDQEGSVVVTSELTLLETVVGTRMRGDARAEAAFRKLLIPSPSMIVRPIDLAVLERAIDLRLLGLKTPDAIYVATGMLEGCDVFLTRDRDWAKAGVTVVDPADVA